MTMYAAAKEFAECFFHFGPVYYLSVKGAVRRQRAVCEHGFRCDASVTVTNYGIETRLVGARFVDW